jgi:dTDP-4-amino-4,6-dideoxygalactose transaminase
MIPFNDLKSSHQEVSAELAAAAQRVLASGWFILGPEVEAFEREFAAYHGVAHAVGVANGTDAIELALRAAGIGPGDEVITVSNVSAPTVCAIERAGATPVLVDVEPVGYTMDPNAAEAAITPRTAAILPVHLYGQMAQIEELDAIAQRHGLLLIEDCAQAHGAQRNGKRAGTCGQLGAFSFYPTKNMGAIGDGGAIITNDSQLADRLRRLRNYGQQSRYLNVERGVNSRLDELQAAFLRIKLARLDCDNATRQALAAAYDALLDGVVIPSVLPGNLHVYHLYVVRHPDRDAFITALGDRGIGAIVHYPIPIHLQPAYSDLGYRHGSLPVTERLANEIVSLPLYCGLQPDDVAKVATDVQECMEVAVG